MAIYFFDSSALVKRYAAEQGTHWVQQITDPLAANSIYVADITLVEVISAMKKLERENRISAPAAIAIISQFRFDFNNQYSVVRITRTIIEHAADLTWAYKLRAYDAVQLAVALAIFIQSQSLNIDSLGVPALTIMSSDNDLNAASLASGLVVENPQDHS